MALPKLLASVSLLALLQLSVSAYCQPIPGHISLSGKDIPLTRILDTLETITGYTHFGETGWSRQARNVTVDIRNANLKQVLDICFRHQPFLTYDLVGKNISVRYKELKDSLVKGRIVNGKDEAVPGATVMVKGTSIAAMTDENGDFSLRLRSSEAGLIISSVNFETQELRVKAGTDTLVQMKQRVAEMSDVTVLHTGYQTIPKERATGSFGKIDNDLLNRRVSTNILDRLDGVAGSVLFNKNNVFGVNQSSIAVRGRSTIFANPEPLIVVDNFPYNGNIYNINPDDVESVTILKDAAAASIWGAFSGNGVIVITTKKGRLDQAPRLEFNTSLTIGRKPDVYAQPILSTADYINVEENLFNHGFYPIGFGATQALSPVAEILLNGALSPAQAQAQINVLSLQDTRQDLARYFFRSSLNQQYSLSLSGGSSNNQYYLSAGYDKDISGLVRNEYDRVTLNGNNTYILLPKKLDLTTGFAFTSSTSQNNNSGSIHVPYPYLRLADTKGNAQSVPYLHSQSYIDTAGGGPLGGTLLDWNYRPFDDLRNSDNVTKLSDYRINIRVHYSLLEGLDASAYYQYGKGTSDLQNFQSQLTYFTRNLINEFTQLNGYRAIPLGGILDETDSSYQANNLRFQLNYDRCFSSGILSVIGGSEYRDIEGNYSTNRLYGYDNDRHTSVAVDYGNSYPQYNDPSTSLQAPNPENRVNTSDHYLSYYFNGSYNLLQKYIISASLRKDESNIFGVSANQKGVPLWSAGAAWEISRESFYHADNWLPYLKLRLTDGYNGNVDKSVSAYTTAVFNTISSYNLISATINNPPNPDLQWEKIHIVNAAIEFGTRNNRIEGSLEYYIKNGVDLIGPKPLDPTTGNLQLIGNFAGMSTHGLDITIRTKVDIGAVRWNAALLFSYTRDRVTNYSLQQTTIANYFTPYLINPMVGKPLYSVYALKWEGLDPQYGNPQGLLNGKISEDYSSLINSSNLQNLAYIGPANPPVFGSLRNSFSWKQFEFSFNIVYKFGYYFRRGSIDYNNLFNGASAGHPDFDKRWQIPGDEKQTNVPSMTFPGDPNRDLFYSNSEILVEKGDHIRLQDIQFNYDLPEHAIAKLPVKSIRFYLYANNIAILWRANHEDIDPDYSMPTSIPNPQTRSLAIGLKMGF